MLLVVWSMAYPNPMHAVQVPAVKENKVVRAIPLGELAGSARDANDTM
jgi:hypothetical protein